ncbi:MAG: hypothetical protein IH945_07455 [Armatimonadetes bacterium]|nr:hypothetical protein [Armatimonadota bacterium]
MTRPLSFAVATIALLAMTAAPCSTHAQVRKTQDGYLLRMKWTKGAVYSYDITISTELSGLSVPLTSVSSTKVLSVSDGVASVEFTMPNPLTGEVTTLVLKADGLGFIGDDGASATGGPKLPKQAVWPGGSWTTETDGIVMGMQVSTTTVYTFERLERVDDVPCVVLSLVTSSSTAGMSANGTGTMYIETRDGHIFKSEINNVFEIDNNGQILKIPNKIVTKRK